MTKATQIKALLKSYADKDDSRFISVALQIAATEARMGHTLVAKDIKKIIEKVQKDTSSYIVPFENKNINVDEELSSMIDISYPSITFSNVALSNDIESFFKGIVKEYQYIEDLLTFGLAPRNKLLLTGEPGVGKTMSASLLASSLNVPLCTIMLDGLITRYMGETSSKLRKVFDFIKNNQAVYLFDEFDAIGTQRGRSDDVGEARRILNTFLMLLEQEKSNSVIISATNHPELLDKALHRRFNSVIKYELPNEVQIKQIIENKLHMFRDADLNYEKYIKKCIGMNCANIVSACEDAIRDAVINNDAKLNDDIVLNNIKVRK